jgi:hypothetical protein
MRVEQDYGEAFRDAYAVLHGGRPDEIESATERRPGEPIEEYLSRTRSEALGVARKRLLAARPPDELAEAHRLLLDLLTNAAAADEALAEQVRAYQCGQFHESVTHSDRLQQLVVESQRMDRELIAVLLALPVSTQNELGIATE